MKTEYAVEFWFAGEWHRGFPSYATISEAERVKKEAEKSYPRARIIKKTITEEVV